MNQIDIAVAQEPKVSELRRVAFGTPAETVKEIAAEDGGLILTGTLNKDQIAAINEELATDIAQTEIGQFGKAVASVTKRDGKAAQYAGSLTRHVQHCYKRSRTYREALLANPIFAEYLSVFMPWKPGTHSIYASVVIEIHPGEKAQDLHRDGENYFAPLGLNNADSVCYLVNSMLALRDITEEMGATRIIPGSHKWPDFSHFGSPSMTTAAAMQAGDMLLYNGKVLHGGGANTTQDQPRRALATAFSFPFVMGEEAWPFSVSVEEVRSYPKQVQSMIGFRSKSHHGEEPGFFWRVETQPLEDFLTLRN